MFLFYLFGIFTLAVCGHLNHSVFLFIFFLFLLTICQAQEFVSIALQNQYKWILPLAPQLETNVCDNLSGVFFNFLRSDIILHYFKMQKAINILITDLENS